MTLGSVARRYATALFAIGEERGNLLGVLRNVQSVADVYNESEPLRDIMGNPEVKMDVRRGILKEIGARLGVQDVVRNFLGLLFDKSRIDMLPDISRELNALADQKLNRVRAEVISAAPVADAVVTELKSTLERLTGKVVIMSTKEDPRLLGGIVTRVQDMMFDGSLKRHLDILRESMRGRT
jgi:F-type H+-transporting ATPase subunit delta